MRDRQPDWETALEIAGAVLVIAFVLWMVGRALA